jgi:hypothetical protein
LARSSTTAQPGDRLALKHGAQSEATIEAALPAKVEALESWLSEEVRYLEPPDRAIIVNFARVLVQADQLAAYYESKGGILDSRGRPRASWKLWQSTQHSLREFSKLLGLGPAERARMTHAMSGAAVDMAQVRASQDRMRMKLGWSKDADGQWIQP